jgi:Tol biopolymer transport system component
VSIYDLQDGTVKVVSPRGGGRFCGGHAWSPDSRSVALVTGPGSSRNVHVINSDDGTISNLTRLRGGGAPFLFTPDGKTVLLFRKTQGLNGKVTMWGATRGAAEAVVLTQNFEPAPSGFGTNVVFASKRAFVLNDDGQLFSTPAAGFGLTPFTPPAAG